jgi:hypothetical protein
MPARVSRTKWSPHPPHESVDLGLLFGSRRRASTKGSVRIKNVVVIVVDAGQGERRPLVELEGKFRYAEGVTEPVWIV